MRKLLIAALLLLAPMIACAQGVPPIYNPGLIALTGDCTTAASVITCTKTNGVSFGTAATVNTGTSGATIPLLNGTNTIGGVWTFPAGDFVLGTAVSGDIGTFNASHALQDSGTLLTALAPLASPTFTGTVTMPDGTTWSSSTISVATAFTMGNHGITGANGLSMNNANASSLANVVATSTVPTVINNRADTSTGLGGASGHSDLIAGGVNQVDCISTGCTNALLLTLSAGLTETGAAASINASSNFNTNINTGTSTGTITIGNSSNTGKTTIANLATAAADNGTCNSAAGVISSAGVAACTGISTARVKNHIAPLKLGLATVLASKPVRYFYNKGVSDNGINPHYGFLAEDVQKLAPELVTHDAKGRPLSWRWNEWEFVLTNALKEQQGEISTLFAAVKQERKEINDLKRQLAARR